MTGSLQAADSQRLQQIRKLTQVSRALTYAASLDEVLQLTVEYAADLLAAETSLLMVASDDGALALRSSRGVDAALAQRLHGPLNEALIPQLAGVLGTQPESLLAVPLVVAGAIKGLLFVVRTDPASDAEQDEWILSALADQAAITLEQTRLHQVGEFREQLIGIVSHDLRNPLHTISMAAQLLIRRQDLGEEEIELTRRIASSASQAVRLTEQLLDLTRSRLGGGIPVALAPLDLNAVCRQLTVEVELSHPDGRLRVDAQGDLVGSWDRDRIYQLLSNLVGNAVQHGDPSSPIHLKIDGTNPTEVAIEVANRGQPIPPALLPFIFDAFRQVRKSPSSHTHGLGLGLFIAQQIARSHRGVITVTSSESDGTRFRVRLPRGARPPDTEATHQST